MTDKKDKLIIGLTGGIATGKSTVSSYLAEKYFIPILDADLIAREAVSINSPIFQNIVNRYGEEILLKDGNLNRAKLGKIIFNSPQEKMWLENQIHPFVFDDLQSQIKLLSNSIIVLSIPLLFEAKMTNLVDEIWVVNCDFFTQLSRLKSRNKLAENEAISRINSQIPLTEKVKLADVVIDNNKKLADLYTQIDLIMSKKSITSNSYLHR
ncbi:MAG: dephospho-CoA kinase [Cyanobacteria bacterium]|nr:dephospho-CoA kinase [Cyanobacteria bacterium CG_2015-16_32_12]NCO78856.1 dephospho-CoA kinase [Cyanobacteria bacterium CG_2015-22_32_23]NCQ05097.1 dephospho-CoA kinase [Cyanobacteria bacterium CG_2015-09_32_10]NCQ42568.1 dephospho-CoA kinase [Cyanobacteria bacterium CG_2015-04_32_10]NCS85382.1 dephospho-CoA kinase [Cyanobacteria bacterium CG_2015-02_32_10]